MVNLDDCGICDDNSLNDCKENCKGNFEDGYVVDDGGNCCRENQQLKYYIDTDKDGFGETSEIQSFCVDAENKPSNFVLNNLDCVDSFGIPAYVDKCGVCNPNIINASCTGRTGGAPHLSRPAV